MKLTREEVLEIGLEAGLVTKIYEGGEFFELTDAQAATPILMKFAALLSVHVDKPLAESAVAPGECGSVPDERTAFEVWFGRNGTMVGKMGRDSDGEYTHAVCRGAWAGWQARAALGMQPPNNQPNSDHVAVIGAKPDSVHLDKPAETATDTSAWDTDKRAAFEKWAAEYDRLFMSGSYNNKITWSAFRAGVAYQAGCNKDTAILAAYRTLIHTHHIEPDGSEFGFCRVRHDRYGRLDSCLWAGHDEVEAAVTALVAAQSGISSPSHRPNEKDVVGEGK